MLMISVVFKILLNSIVCFLHISSSYFRVRGIIKVAVFSRFYGSIQGPRNSIISGEAAQVKERSRAGNFKKIL